MTPFSLSSLTKPTTFLPRLPSFHNPKSTRKTLNKTPFLHFFSSTITSVYQPFFAKKAFHLLFSPTRPTNLHPKPSENYTKQPSESPQVLTSKKPPYQAKPQPKHTQNENENPTFQFLSLLRYSFLSIYSFFS